MLLIIIIKKNIISSAGRGREVMTKVSMKLVTVPWSSWDWVS